MLSLKLQVNNLQYAANTTFMEESKELKSLLMKVKEKSEKASLKVNIQKKPNKQNTKTSAFTK